MRSMSSVKYKWGTDMKVGDLVKNTHPESGWHGQVAVIYDFVYGTDGYCLLRVIWRGKECVWIGNDCEVINASR